LKRCERGGVVVLALKHRIHFAFEGGRSISFKNDGIEVEINIEYNIFKLELRDEFERILEVISKNSLEILWWEV